MRVLTGLQWRSCVSALRVASATARRYLTQVRDRWLNYMLGSVRFTMAEMVLVRNGVRRSCREVV